MNWYLKALKNYVGFEGRSLRKEYWMFFLFNIIISYGLIIFAVITEVSLLMFAAVLYSLGTLLPSLAVAVRRMHDVGKSGRYILVPIYSLVLVCTEGESSGNTYGTDPKLREKPDL